MEGLRRDFLNSLRATKLPPYLWRVQHADSQASFEPNGTLKAALSHRLPSSQYELRASLTRHLKWGYSRAQSHFISTFDSYDLAIEWARAKLPLGSSDEDMQIYRISTTNLGEGAMVFNVGRLVRRLGIDDILELRGGLEREFVILNEVRCEAVEFIENVSVGVERSERGEKRRTPWGRTLERRTRVLEGVTVENLAKVERGGQGVKERVLCWVPDIEERDVSEVEEEDGGSERVDSLVEEKVGTK